MQIKLAFFKYILKGVKNFLYLHFKLGEFCINFFYEHNLQPVTNKSEDVD